MICLPCLSCQARLFFVTDEYCALFGSGDGLSPTDQIPSDDNNARDCCGAWHIKPAPNRPCRTALCAVGRVMSLSFPSGFARLALCGRAAEPVGLPEFAVHGHTAGIDATFQKVGLVAKVHVF
jgi:hypothetical protein